MRDIFEATYNITQLDAINAFVDTCNDASDNIQRNPKYLAPLQVLPNSELSSSATGSIRVSSCAAAKKVRIFQKDGSNWKYIGANHTFTADELKVGLDLGIDSRDVRRPDAWDGNVVVHLTVSDGADAATDSVALRVAPVLTHHHAQPVSKAFTVAVNYDISQVQFVADFKNNVADAGIDEPVFVFSGFDRWAQDFFEPGYASIPGPDGPVVIRVMIRSAQKYRDSGLNVFEHLRSDTVGAIQQMSQGGTIDSLGNLETIPPYTHNGNAYPAGRIIMGQWDGVHPFMFDLLEAQEVQAPIALDTSWLAVGHVDEFVQFLPAHNQRGWVMMVDDPLAGLEILQKAARNGHGGERAVSRPKMATDAAGSCLPEHTVDEVLNLSDFAAINRRAAERIEHNIEILKNETGITDDEIFRVPSLFYYEDQPVFACTDGALKLNGGPSVKALSILEAAQPLSKQGIRRRQTSFGTQVVAFYPGTINSVVLTDSLILAPNPWGPIVDGVDILAEAVSSVYAKAQFNVTYQDDWFSYHLLMGEIHCGSNTWRDTSATWW
nr:arginine deiminase type-3 [Colletotrichum truncatum]KAF6790226.1 arginine deiminase type-3 [Colletotrichum truncatum]